MIMILLMGAISYLLRVIPFLMGNKKIKKDGFLITSLDYSVCFILGSIIVNISLGNIKISELIYHFEIKYALAIITVITAYFISKRTGSILKSLIISSVLFTLISWWVNEKNMFF
ncbi:AzlD domain-containing protein [Xenorhabdus stockiae]|uniref:AzlD domain-containing protein n=1 Tax=Xenorhabdus stockiae TaxID=351614 RepID=UPI003CEE9278